ncbi:helitron helicase-like protein [Phytophthora cinnamomi]|uniref:helitron helicase-like protein n=1 Tax=Phytophthora cinnamomi TaxID=4785 RepID=UPI003559AB79|nr:helitron helicase-like protein [Phytophthora cinnamomi]
MGHYLGSLLPRIDTFTNQPMPPKFAQIYIVVPDMQQRAERRRGIFADLDSGTLLEIEQMMEECNPFAQQYLNFAEKLRADQAAAKEVVDMVFRLHEKRSNPRTHNLPTVSEVGATLIEDGNLDSPRDILLRTKDHSLLRLFETHSVYDPLQYPLLLPHGELGWTYTDVYANNVVRRKKREMSLREHVAYRLFQKVGDESPNYGPISTAGFETRF